MSFLFDMLFGSSQPNYVYLPPPPPAPEKPKYRPPSPDLVNSMHKQIRQNDALARKPKGRSANILTSARGDTNLPTTARKVLGGMKK